MCRTPRAHMRLICVNSRQNAQVGAKAAPPRDFSIAGFGVKARRGRNMLLRNSHLPQGVEFVVSRARNQRCVVAIRGQQVVAGRDRTVALVQRGWRCAQTVDDGSPCRFLRRTMVSVIDVTRKRSPRSMSACPVRVAAARPELPPPPPPIPRPPPSERCSNTTRSGQAPE